MANLAAGQRGFSAGNQSLKFKVDENLPTEYASIPSWSRLRNSYGRLRRETMGCPDSMLSERCRAEDPRPPLLQHSPKHQLWMVRYSRNDTPEPTALNTDKGEVGGSRTPRPTICSQAAHSGPARRHGCAHLRKATIGIWEGRQSLTKAPFTPP
jgi:hypothetical protein